MFINGFFSNKKIKDNWVSGFIKLFAREDNWHNLDINNLDLGYGWIHYSLIRLVKPKRVLCIGSRYGYIPAICAMACRDNGFGVVDFVDADFDQNNSSHINHWGGVGFWKKINSKSYFGRFNLEKYINLNIMTTRTFIKKFPERNWGYIHIDGDHSYEGSRYDFINFWKSLEAGGFCALHDIYPESNVKLDYGVYKLWDQLKNSKNFNTMEFPGSYGLGIIQKSK